MRSVVSNKAIQITLLVISLRCRSLRQCAEWRNRHSHCFRCEPDSTKYITNRNLIHLSNSTG